MLELADKGLNELSLELDSYIADISQNMSARSLDLTIDSINLARFMDEWAQKSHFPLEPLEKANFSELIAELSSFQIFTLADLKNIIPENFSEICKEHNYRSTIYGIIRDWMLIHDWKRFKQDVKFDWSMGTEEIVSNFLSEEERDDFAMLFPLDDADADIEIEEPA